MIKYIVAIAAISFAMPAGAGGFYGGSAAGGIAQGAQGRPYQPPPQYPQQQYEQPQPAGQLAYLQNCRATMSVTGQHIYTGLYKFQNQIIERSFQQWCPPNISVY